MVFVTVKKYTSRTSSSNRFSFFSCLSDPDPEVGCDVFAHLPPDNDSVNARLDEALENAFNVDEIPFMLSQNPLPTIIQVWMREDISS